MNDKLYAQIENGQVIQFISGSIPQGTFVEVPEDIAGDFTNYDYDSVNDIWVKREKAETVIIKSNVERLVELEQLVADLASLTLGV